MSTSTPLPESRHRSPDSASPQRRDNWWGDNETDAETEDHGHDTDESERRREHAEFVAHKVHRQVAPKHCPITRFQAPDRGELWDVPAPEARVLNGWLHDSRSLDDAYPWPDELPDHDPWAMHEENRIRELTDPEIHVPREYEGSIRHEEFGQRRHRSRYNGTDGYITGPHLGDVDEVTFLAEVRVVLDYAMERGDILESEAETLQRDARRMKRSQGTNDEEALANIIEDIYEASE